MKVFREKIDYVDCTRQYNLSDFSDGRAVEARYIPNKLHPGNPFIEALPEPMSIADCKEAYTIDIPDYDRKEILNMTDDERIHNLQGLRQLRLPMPYDAALESEMYRALERSYSRRYTLCGDVPVPGIHGANIAGIEPVGKAVTDSYSSIEGFCLLGSSGTGKSSAIDILKSHIPQVILHPNTRGRMAQIVYLYVVCPPNSNFRVLYTQIGAQIDKALGITDGTYENLCSKNRDQFTAVKQLIEIFAVGVIIFDEIQELNFNGMKSNTFANLVTLSELTGVAIAVVGLESAYSQLFQHFYTGRRVGRIINSNSLLTDKRLFIKIARDMLAYQWFDHYVNPEEELIGELIDRLYEYTCGSIDALVTLYMYMHVEYFANPRGRRCDVDVALLEKVVDKYYGKLRQLLAKAKKERNENGDFDKRFVKIQKEAKGKYSSLVSEESTSRIDEMNKTILKADTPTVAYTALKEQVLSNISSMYPDADTGNAEDAFDKLWRSKKNHVLSVMELTGKVISSLHGENKKLHTNKKKTAKEIESMRQDLKRFEA